MWTDKGDINGLFEQYGDILRKYGCSDEDILDLQNRWNEPHRVYHNQDHLLEILDLIEQSNKIHHKNMDPLEMEKDIKEYESLILCAFFHDAVYDPKSKTNEEDSHVLFKKMCRKENDSPEKKLIVYEVERMILDTKDHTKEPHSEISAKFLKFDLNGLINGSLSRMIQDEKKLFREFGFVDYSIYKKSRKELFLDKFAPHVKKINSQSHIDEYIDWFNHYTPKIAVFAGTFVPMHLGHLDILKRAEQMFDKVIVLLCINPKKSNDSTKVIEYIEKELRPKLPNNQIDFYNGMLHEYVKGCGYPITVVKGLRNPSDFDSEKIQLRYMEDMHPEIKVAYIICDRKFEHVSSSGITMIQNMKGGIDEASKYLF